MTALALDTRVERGKELAMPLRSLFPGIAGLIVCSQTRNQTSPTNGQPPLAARPRFQTSENRRSYYLYAPFIAGTRLKTASLYILCVELSTTFAAPLSLVR
jgi:hypothetical protein